MAQGVHRSPFVYEPAFEPAPVTGEQRPGRASARRLHAGRTLAVAALVVGVVAVLAPRAAQQPTGNTGAARSGAATAVPLAARLAVSRALGADERSYWVGAGLAASNAPQRMSMRFNASGVTVATAGGHIGLSLVASGRGTHLRQATPAIPVTRANRVAYARPGTVEWFANGPSGLEQGLTLDRRPAGSGSLSFAFALSGSLRPQLDGGSTVVLGTRGDRVPLRYTGLSAYDARGRQLPASLELRGNRLLIGVNDAGAVYPVRIDPLIATLTTTEGGGDLGASVAVSGSVLVAGAPTADSERGAAYVFVEPPTGWASATQTAKLTASDRLQGDRFGSAVAVSQPATGTTKVVVGAPGVEVPEGTESEAESDAGAAYVFVEPVDRMWHSVTQNAELIAASRTANATFGAAVAVGTTSSGVATVAVGAPTASDFKGDAYVFEESEAVWTGTKTETKLLEDPNGGLYDEFGHSLAITDDGATIVAGAPDADESHGAVDVFAKPEGGWSGAAPTPAMLTASPASPDGFLGQSVAASGSTIVAGAPYANSYAGALYVFTEPPEGWKTATQTAELKTSDGGYDELGKTTALAEVPSCLSALSIGGEDLYDFSEAQSGWVSTADASSLALPPYNPGPDATSYGLAVAAAGATAFVGGDDEAVEAFGLHCPERSTTPPTPTTTTRTTTTTTTTTAVPPTAAATLALGCSGAEVTLLDVVEDGNHVKLTGAAVPSLIGKTVEIIFAGKHKVASAKVASNGLFSASAPLPPAKERNSNNARYIAQVGKLKSPSLKLTRRLILDPPTVSHGKVQLTGEVIPPLTRPPYLVSVEERITCKPGRIVAHVNPGSSGHFSVQVTPPSGKSAVIYRLTSKVPANASRTKLGPTASLPEVVSLG
jgi:hypothetical protein